MGVPFKKIARKDPRKADAVAKFYPQLVTLGDNATLDEKIQQLHEAMEAVAQTAVDAEKWVGLMRQYVNPTELTAELLNTLIEKIFVHEAVKGEDGSREQEVEIFYRFIGKID